MMLIFFGFALLAGVKSSSLPSPCTLSKYTTNPATRWIAVDYCHAQRNWEELQNKTNFVPSGSHLLKLLQQQNANSCNFETNPWCGVVLSDFCTKSNTFDLLSRCKPLVSLFSDNTKMCDCGLLAGCQRRPINSHNAEMETKCRQHLSHIPNLDHIKYTDYCMRYYNVSLTLAETTWNASVTHNWTSFAALDACTAVANHGQRTTVFTDIFARYVVQHASSTRQVAETLQLRCNLLEMNAGPIAGPYFAGLMQQWFAQYCA